MDVGRAARDRLHNAGLISAPVTRMLAQEDSTGAEFVEVTVLDDASEAEVARIHDVLGTLPHRVVRRPIEYGVTYLSPRRSARRWWVVATVYAVSGLLWLVIAFLPNNTDHVIWLRFLPPALLLLASAASGARALRANRN